MARQGAGWRVVVWSVDWGSVEWPGRAIFGDLLLAFPPHCWRIWWAGSGPYASGLVLDAQVPVTSSRCLTSLADHSVSVALATITELPGDLPAIALASESREHDSVALPPWQSPSFARSSVAVVETRVMASHVFALLVLAPLELSQPSTWYVCSLVHKFTLVPVPNLRLRWSPQPLPASSGTWPR